MNYKDFFVKWGDWHIQHSLLPRDETMTIEGLYQLFKARLIDEVKAEFKPYQHFADLVEKE